MTEAVEEVTDVRVVEDAAIVLQPAAHSGTLPPSSRERFYGGKT